MLPPSRFATGLLILLTLAGRGAAEAPFKPLFDGESLAGWIGGTDSYEVVDGVLASKAGHGGNLYTKRQFADFVLRLEFRLTPGANNGIALRAPGEGDPAYVAMESQVLDNDSDKFKGLNDYQYHGSIYGVAPAKRGFLKPVGEWNRQEVRCEGTRVTVTLNDEKIVDVDLAEAAPGGKTIDGREHPGLFRESGHVGFLGHGDRVYFRNIEIQKISK